VAEKSFFGRAYGKEIEFIIFARASARLIRSCL
jgi:hypothetical protein